MVYITLGALPEIIAETYSFGISGSYTTDGD